MSKHHTLPPIACATPPKPKKTEKKRRTGVGLLGQPDETAEPRESVASAQPVATFSRFPQEFPEIEGADRKAHHSAGRLSQGTLSVLCRRRN